MRVREGPVAANNTTRLFFFLVCLEHSALEALHHNIIWHFRNESKPHPEHCYWKSFESKSICIYIWRLRMHGFRNPLSTRICGFLRFRINLNGIVTDNRFKYSNKNNWKIKPFLSLGDSTEFSKFTFKSSEDYTNLYQWAFVTQSPHDAINNNTLHICFN